LIGQYLAAQRRAIVTGDVELRRGEDAIHATRVGVRRYRSILRVFADLLDDERAKRPDKSTAENVFTFGLLFEREWVRRSDAEQVALG
jgi:CHAD domain-containing protein